MEPHKEQKFVSLRHGGWRSKTKGQTSASGEDTFQTITVAFSMSSQERNRASYGPLFCRDTSLINEGSTFMT